VVVGFEFRVLGFAFTNAESITKYKLVSFERVLILSFAITNSMDQEMSASSGHNMFTSLIDRQEIPF